MNVKVVSIGEFVRVFETLLSVLGDEGAAFAATTATLAVEGLTGGDLLNAVKSEIKRREIETLVSVADDGELLAMAYNDKEYAPARLYLYLTDLARYELKAEIEKLEGRLLALGDTRQRCLSAIENAVASYSNMKTKVVADPRGDLFIRHVNTSAIVRKKTGKAHGSVDKPKNGRGGRPPIWLECENVTLVGYTSTWIANTGTTFSHRHIGLDQYESEIVGPSGNQYRARGTTSSESARLALWYAVQGEPVLRTALDAGKGRKFQHFAIDGSVNGVRDGLSLRDWFGDNERRKALGIVTEDGELTD